MVQLKIELPNGNIRYIDITGETKIKEILQYLDLEKVYVFGERWNGEIGTPMVDINRDLIYYNIWFPNDKKYIPSIVILKEINETDKNKYEFYKSVGYYNE
jgi:hypothetical protein